MDVIVSDAEGLPDRAYLSIRAGDIRKQVQYKRGECFRFDVKAAPRHLTVDVFEKIGSTQVSLHDLLGGEVDKDVAFASRRGGPLKIGMTVKMDDKESAVADDKKDKRQARHQAALEAKNYLDEKGIQKLLQSMIHELLAAQPEDAICFMSEYLQEHALPGSPAKAQQRPSFTSPMQDSTAAPSLPAQTDAEDAFSEDSLPDWSSKLGLGDDEMPGFPVDGSAPLPSLEDHHSMLAKVLREAPSIYASLQDERTPGGVSLAKCIKTGIDNRGHKLIRTIGVVAGDEDCYDVFRDVFEPVVRQLHGAYPADAVHPSDLDLRKVITSPIDPSGKYTVSVQVCGSRNLSGLPMLPSISREERKEVERLICNALMGLEGDLRGKYHPLRGSSSFGSMPRGMSEEMESELQAKHLIFDEPDTPMVLSSGFGRNWPEARGIFVSDVGDVAVWVNEADHLKIFARRDDQDLQRAFSRFAQTVKALRVALQAAGRDYAASRHFGFLSSCPSNLGNSLSLVVTLCMPMLGAAQHRFRAMAREFGLSACLHMKSSDAQEGEAARGTYWDVSVACCLGQAAAAQVNALIDGCRQLLEMEQRLEAGEDIELPEVAGSSQARAAKKLLSSSTLVFEDAEDSELSDDECPDDLPDLARKFSMAAEVLRENPSIYTRLKDVTTSSGTPFGRCIRACLETDGHPLIKTIGAAAGDAECYDAFRELFDPIIAMKHPGYKPHVTDMNWTQVSGSEMDPSGNHVLEVKVRVQRNLRGFRMLPNCRGRDRREVEACLVKMFEGVASELQGEYLPLLGSSSCSGKPEGMSEQDEELMRAKGFLFEEPDSQVLAASGYGRGWPDARGIYTSREEDVVAWVNELDHLRLSVRQNGSDLKGAFKRLCQLHKEMQNALEAVGHGFARHDRLGFLGSCPSQLGTCLLVSVVVRIPRLSALPNFRAVCKDMKLQVQTSTRSGLQESPERVWEVSNLERLGTTEVEQVSAVLEGCRAFNALEVALEKGEKVVLEPGVPLPLPAELRGGEVGYSETPGLGNGEYPGFPVDECPEQMPDLSRHSNLAADVLKKDPSLYVKLKDLRTSRGVSFARCIKTGMDNIGHPMIKTVGAVAGDAECYSVFQAFFDHIIRERHCGCDTAGAHPTDLDPEKVITAPMDPSGEYVVSVKVRAGRNLQSFRMPPAISREDRKTVERLLADALSELQGELQGSYLPLRGSTTYSSRLAGMSAAEEEQLYEEGLLLQEPDANVVLAAGTGRNWPEARGVFVTQGRELAAWINEEEHLKLISSQEGSDFKAAFHRLCVAEASVRASLEKLSHSFARSSNLGFLSTCPSNLGTGLCAEALVSLPSSSAKPGFRSLCKRLRLLVRSAAEFGDGLWTVSNSGRLGSSEVEQVNAVIRGVQQLVALERRLDGGEEVDLDTVAAAAEAKVPNPAAPSSKTSGSARPEAPLAEAASAPEPAAKGAKPRKKEDCKVVCVRAQSVLAQGSRDGRLKSILQSMAMEQEAAEASPRSVAFSDIPGLGDTEVPGFPTDECPDQLPDLSQHHSIATNVLKKDPAIYSQLKGLRTSSGICLAKCIKPGMDNRGHPMIRTIGAVAGDAECYELFKGLFDEIIQVRHAGYALAVGTSHPIDLDVGKVSADPIDSAGKYVLSARVEASRNLSGTPFPTSISKEDRRRVESIVTKALSQLNGDLQGEYLPLASSGSYAPRPDGMEESAEADLDRHGLLFQEPDSALMLCAGVGRHWPEARGIFVNPGQSFAVWVNEEDHLRFISVQSGSGLREAFRRFSEAEGAVCRSLRSEALDYAKTGRLGFLTSCPSKLGSGGFQVSMLMRLPLLSGQQDFKAVCRRLGVQARMLHAPDGGDAWSVSQAAQLGHSEVELVNRVFSACHQLIAMEVQLEQGGEAATAPSS